MPTHFQYENDHHSGLAFATEERVKIKKPTLYKVILHNDDYTPMDFVTNILIEIFRKNRIDAEQIMLNIHQKGIGICGLYPLDIARTKHAQVSATAKENGHPLKCTLEPEDMPPTDTDQAL